MSEKKCAKCCEIKPLDEFLWRNKSKNQKHSVCRICYKELRKKSYINNSDYYKNKSKKRRVEHSKLYEKYKKNSFCKICGENESACLDFHHIDSSIKDFSVSTMKYSSGSFETTMKEIEKCIILCANCHRKVHAGIISLDGVMEST
jgi:hypothetical protein